MTTLASCGCMDARSLPACGGGCGRSDRQYEAKANLTGLLERFKSGVRRVHPSKTRSLRWRTKSSSARCGDEQDFLDCSYGFRPGRGAPSVGGAVGRR